MGTTTGWTQQNRGMELRAPAEGDWLSLTPNINKYQNKTSYNSALFVLTQTIIILLYSATPLNFQIGLKVLFFFNSASEQITALSFTSLFFYVRVFYALWTCIMFFIQQLTFTGRY